MNKKFKSLLSKISVVEDHEEEFDDDYGYDEEDETEAYSEPASQTSQSTFTPAKPKANYGAKTGNLQMLVVEPTEYEGVEKMAEALRQFRPVLINFEKTNAQETTRIIDFISGAAFVLDGHIEKVGKDILLCVPKNVSVDHSEKSAFAEMPEDMISNWKESGL